MFIKELLNLIRIKQWYKNFVIFIPLVFSLNLLHPELFIKTILGFISLCLVSSSYYITNDIVDIKRDIFHPEKRKRALASKKVKIQWAVIIMPILLASSLFIASKLSDYFLYSVIFLFLFTQIYNFFLKNEVFADAISIAINFATKATSGVFVINVAISPWIIICTFFLSLFLVFGKRKADLIKLKESAHKYNLILKDYSENLLNLLIIIAATSLLMSYAIYIILLHKNLIPTFPVFLYAIMRYLSFIEKGSIIARHPEKVFSDIRIVISLLLWLVMVVLILYSQPSLNLFGL